ncbi:MAG: AtpZ/AtpI family protein [Flavobacteriaceae bacterium]|nr:AtpZ/AtpI family protein [Flavobacteriaceae bacterium]
MLFIVVTILSKLPNQPSPHSYAKYTGLAFQLIAVILALTFGGNYLDKYLVWHFPLFTLLGALSGMGISLYLLFKTIK